MGRSQKSKKVTWASDVNLCQVRLFLSEESPSQVGGTQDHLQAKALWAVQSGPGPDDNLPPGFEGIQPGNLWRVNLSQIPLTKWKRPVKFVVNIEWRVVAGEESSEMEVQNQRELRVLEAIYPRPSAIPPNPLLMGVEDSTYNDQNTLQVPITPIEDEDATIDPSFVSMATDSTVMLSQPQQILSSSSESSSGISATDVEPDIVAAAQAALSSIASAPGTLIDPDLLVKILSDPKMLEKLVSNVTPSTTQNNIPTMFHNMPNAGVQSSMHNVPLSSIFLNRAPIGIPNVTQNIPITRMQNIPSTSSTNARPIMKTQIDPMGLFYPSSTIRPVSSVPTPSPSAGVPMAKDINYYKSLIQQHGAEKREILPQFGQQSSQHMGTSQEMKSRDSKPKIMKPCLYFNTSRGCRNGATCPFQHDASSSGQRVSGVSDVQNAKRMKLDREITGT